MLNNLCLVILTTIAPTEVTINVNSAVPMDYILIVDGNHVQSGDVVRTYKSKFDVEIWHRGENGPCFRAWTLTSPVGNTITLDLTIRNNPINWCKNGKQVEKFHRTISDYNGSNAY